MSKNITIEKETTEANAVANANRNSTKTKRKKKILKIIFGIFASLFGLVLLVASVGAIITKIGNSANTATARSIAPVKYDNRIIPVIDEDGCYNFITDDEFKIMQLTDIHIGAGYLSLSKDEMAMNAIASMITEQNPDLVVVTGDIAYPVPFQSGTLNNLNAAKLFAELMESLGVYWTPTFGNHDAEAYSYYSREDVSDFYENLKNEGFKYCLYMPGPEDIDGFGNQVIKIKDSKGLITQAVFVFDSHSYIDGDIFGIMWKYDNIKDSQINWYKEQISKMTAFNEEIIADNEIAVSDEKRENCVPVKSIAFFHVPLEEYKIAWEEFAANNYKDTENVSYKYGMAGEVGRVIYCGIGEDNLFETMLELGSTKGIFCGHDHFNNFSIDYKGIRLTYSMTVDYLAYIGISKKGSQRGCTIINVDTNGNFTCEALNYYKDFSTDLLLKRDEVDMQFADVTYQVFDE